MTPIFSSLMTTSLMRFGQCGLDGTHSLNSNNPFIKLRLNVFPVRPMLSFTFVPGSLCAYVSTFSFSPKTKYVFVELENGKSIIIIIKANL